MRLKALAGLLTCLITTAVAAADGSDGFVSLFDGKTLDGWISVSTDRFSVREGVIFGDGGTGWLRSAKAYKDFELKGDFRIVRAGSDSGVFIRATPDSTPKAPNWPVMGYQLQLIDGDSQFMLFGHGTPCMFDRKADALKQANKPLGEWQSLRIKVIGSHAELALNGVTVTVSDAISLSAGHIGLQGENGQFEWKGLSIKELPVR